MYRCPANIGSGDEEISLIYIVLCINKIDSACMHQWTYANVFPTAH